MHRMNMTQLQDALQNTPALIEKHGLQFEDGNRLITIPPEFSFGLAGAISAALGEMIAEAELTKTNYRQILKKLLILLVSILSVNAFAHGGGVDERGCHAKNGVRHCHGENTGKYLPEKEPVRIKKLHNTTCNTLLPEGGYPKHDLYGKRCNKRN